MLDVGHDARTGWGLGNERYHTAVETGHVAVHGAVVVEAGWTDGVRWRMRRGRSCSRITRTHVQKERGEGRWVRWWFPGAQPELRSELLVTSPPPMAQDTRERHLGLWRGVGAGSERVVVRPPHHGIARAQDGWVWVERSRGWPRTTGCARTTNRRGNLSRATKVEQSLTGARRGECLERQDFVRGTGADLVCWIRVEHRKEHRRERKREREEGRERKREKEKGSWSLRGGPEWTVVEFPSASIYPLLRGPMTAAREERNRLWIRMSPCLFADSLRHVAPVLPFLWILVILLNGEWFNLHLF